MGGIQKYRTTERGGAEREVAKEGRLEGFGEKIRTEAEEKGETISKVRMRGEGEWEGEDNGKVDREEGRRDRRTGRKKGTDNSFE